MLTEDEIEDFSNGRIWITRDVSAPLFYWKVDVDTGYIYKHAFHNDSRMDMYTCSVERFFYIMGKDYNVVRMSKCYVD